MGAFSRNDKTFSVDFGGGEIALYRSFSTFRTLPNVRLHTCKDGDTLPYISWLYYGSSDNWYKIADFNNSILDPTIEFQVGEILSIPF